MKNYGKTLTGKIILAFIFCAVITGITLAQEENFFFKSGGDTADALKFMKFRNRLSERISEKEKGEITFALGEYCFKNNIYRESKTSFQNYIEQNPSGVTALLANVYLFKLATLARNEGEIEAIKKEVFQNQFVLLFEKFQTLTYKSRWQNTYEIHYFIDKIEVYLNSRLFAEIIPQISQLEGDQSGGQSEADTEAEGKPSE